MALLCCNCHAEATSIDWASIGAVLVGIVAIIFSYLQFSKSLNAEKMREERKDIESKLNDFYGPLLQLRMKSNRIYEKFSDKFRKQDAGFATLTYLLNGHSFQGNDKVLLEEILKIGKQSEELIHNKAGLIDDSHLRLDVIPRATTHFLILRLAYEKALTGDADMYKDLTFPRELDGLLEKRKKELEDRLKELNKTT